MDLINFDDLDLLDFGNTIQIAGVIWTGKGHTFITPGPNSQEKFDNVKLMKLDLAQWTSLLKQTDTLETTMFGYDAHGKIIKTLYRKSQRQIDSAIQWAVFQRDGYSCLYCGRTGVPLTVDHIFLWEKGGPSTMENLVAACRRCNKERGNTEYDEWIESALYKKLSANLTDKQKRANIDRILELPKLRKSPRQSLRGR